MSVRMALAVVVAVVVDIVVVVIVGSPLDTRVPSMKTAMIALLLLL